MHSFFVCLVILVFILLLPVFFWCLLLLFATIFAHFVWLLFFAFLLLDWQQGVPLFWFSFALCCLLTCFLITHIHLFCYAFRYFPFIPSLDALWSPWPHMSTCSKMHAVHMHCKTCLSQPFTPRFTLFFLSSAPMHPSEPIRTHLHPSAPILDTFGRMLQNMTSGEISPAIGIKSRPARPLMPPAYLVFVLPVPTAPQRIHPHLCTPIYTYMCPFAPWLSMYMCVI